MSAPGPQVDPIAEILHARYGVPRGKSWHQLLAAEYVHALCLLKQAEAAFAGRPSFWLALVAAAQTGDIQDFPRFAEQFFHLTIDFHAPCVIIARMGKVLLASESRQTRGRAKSDFLSVSLTRI